MSNGFRMTLTEWTLIVRELDDSQFRIGRAGSRHAADIHPAPLRGSPNHFACRRTQEPALACEYKHLHRDRKEDQCWQCSIHVYLSIHQSIWINFRCSPEGCNYRNCLFCVLWTRRHVNENQLTGRSTNHRARVPTMGLMLPSGPFQVRERVLYREALKA